MKNDSITGLFFIWICISHVFFMLMSINNLNKNAIDSNTKTYKSLYDSVLDLAKEVAKLREEVDQLKERKSS